MLVDYVLRGLKAGLVAGLAFGLFVALVGNPLVGLAETQSHDETGHHGEGGHHESVVSEAVTGAVSVGSGVVWGVLLGVVTFGLAYYFLEPTLPGASDTESYLLAAAGFVTVSGAPWLVLPPRPAGVEQGLPTDVRTFWYATMMVVGAAVCLLSGYAYRRLEPRFGTSTAIGGAALAFGLLGVPVLLAPANPTPGVVSTDLAASHRGFVVFGQAGLWVVLAGAHAWLVRRDRDGGPTAEGRRSAREGPQAVSSD
ncbi:CbtA family protein [Halorussus salinisoli]|uniref:CbtA family protein n=1 Tax=Halorussus salinisoli TaxID=2558242 RepID=UPI0010C245BC|nr:CbtA family protein [Halorussus salinisoli]